MDDVLPRSFRQPHRDQGFSRHDTGLRILTAVNEPIATVAREPGEAERWAERLSQALPAERPVPIDALSAAERGKVRCAVVADPDPADLAALPSLEWVHSTWAGVERMLEELPDTLPIVRLVDPALADVMAEAVLATVLWWHRRGPLYAWQQRWSEWTPSSYVPPQERRVAILGLGALGSRAAERLKECGFEVEGWSRRPKPEACVPCRHGAEGLAGLLPEADAVVCLLPATDETRGALDARAFGAMRKGAAFVNFGRGAVVDEEALLAALDSAHLDHAFLDVFATEPLPTDHAFWGHERVTVWPHVSGPTNPMTAAPIIAQAIGRWRETGEVPEAVDRSRGY